MSTNFPTSKDAYANPLSTDDTNLVSHADQHININDAMVQVETKLGTGNTAPASNTLLYGTGAGTSAWQGLTSAQLASILSDETGSGAAVFSTSPTLTTPHFSSIVNTGTITLPTATDTLVGRATTDTLTNKTISGSSNTITNLPTSAYANASVTSPALKPTYGRVQATANLSLTTSLQDITGCSVTITPTTASNILVWGVFDAYGNGTATAGDLMQGALVVDSSAQGAAATFVFSTTTSRASVVQVWLVSLTAASHTIKLQAENVNHSGGQVLSTHTSMTYLVLSQ